MKCDVMFAGAGLAGLSAERDLMNEDTVIGPFHHVQLVDALGPTIVPSFPSCSCGALRLT